MTRFAGVIEYDGACYHGWQLQKDLPTIQGALEVALERIVGKGIRVHGAGRTDAGVHATGQVAHFVADWGRPVSELHRALNALLPPDVAVRSLWVADDDFHARHSALCKTYLYRVWNHPLRSPLNRLYAWHVPRPLDVANMDEAARQLLGVHDFAAFGAPTDGTPSTVREILQSRWIDHEDGFLEFTVKGTGFLRYMVRSIVGTLILVGSGKLSCAEFHGILESRLRSRAGPTAPPHGLFLQSVEYPGLGACWVT